MGGRSGRRHFWKGNAMTGKIRAMLVLLALIAGLAAGGSAACMADDALTPAQKDAVNKLVHDYIIEHPEVLVEALKDFESRQQAVSETARRQAVDDRQADLFNDPASPIAGNPKGSTTIVEFFDYRCHYCKGMAKDLSDLIDADHDIRFIYKEFPILGPPSEYAAKAALAAQLQNKYRAFHEALYAYKGQLANDIVLDVAGKVGLDTAQLQKDMERPEIAAEIKRNYEIATALKINGTPGFVIGHSVIDGAMPIDKFKALIARERKS
jgi:protein-disulfide isomerase